MYPTQTEIGNGKTTMKYWLSEKEYLSLSGQLSGETKIIFQLILSTGQQFKRLKKLQWSVFNSRLATLNVGDRVCKIPVATALSLDNLRNNAESEDSPIFTIQYNQAWWQASRAYYSLGIDQTAGCLKLPKFTFARKHFEIYKNKAKLARDLGLSTTRWIPKQVFQTTGQSGCLIQF